MSFLGKKKSNKQTQDKERKEIKKVLFIHSTFEIVEGRNEQKGEKYTWYNRSFQGVVSKEWKRASSRQRDGHNGVVWDEGTTKRKVGNAHVFRNEPEGGTHESVHDDRVREGGDHQWRSRLSQTAPTIGGTRKEKFKGHPCGGGWCCQKPSSRGSPGSNRVTILPPKRNSESVYLIVVAYRRPPQPINVHLCDPGDVGSTKGEHRGPESRAQSRGGWKSGDDIGANAGIGWEN